MLYSKIAKNKKAKILNQEIDKNIFFILDKLTLIREKMFPLSFKK